MPKLLFSVIAAAAVLSPIVAHPQYGATNGEWRSYGGDTGSTKYSPLDQIDATNFGELRLAWRWRSLDGDIDLDALPGAACLRSACRLE